MCSAQLQMQVEINNSSGTMEGWCKSPSHLIINASWVFQKSRESRNLYSAMNFFTHMHREIVANVQKNENIAKKQVHTLFHQVDIVNDGASLQRDTNLISVTTNSDSCCRQSGISHVLCTIKIFSKKWIFNNIQIKALNILSETGYAKTDLLGDDQEKNLQEHDERQVDDKGTENCLNATLIVLGKVDHIGATPGWIGT